MKSHALLLMLCGSFLVACSSSDDLQDYVTQVKARPPLPIEPLPVIRNFVPMKYEPLSSREPFIQPSPELAATIQEVKKDCFQPKPREKGPLEKFSLDNLSMRGTMGRQDGLWALVSANDEVYRVKEGQYLGLNQGQVIKINPDGILLEEIIPDGKGCWIKRETKLNLVVAEQ